jgi:hypothetical protein
MYDDNGYVITLFALLSNPRAIATKKYLPYLCTEDSYWRVDVFTYMRGLYVPRNLQHVSILKGSPYKISTNLLTVPRINVYLQFLLLYGHTT